jgi:hypothetical protein
MRTHYCSRPQTSPAAGTTSSTPGWQHANGIEWHDADARDELHLSDIDENALAIAIAETSANGDLGLFPCGTVDVELDRRGRGTCSHIVQLCQSASGKPETGTADQGETDLEESLSQDPSPRNWLKLGWLHRTMGYAELPPIKEYELVTPSQAKEEDSSTTGSAHDDRTINGDNRSESEMTCMSGEVHAKAGTPLLDAHDLLFRAQNGRVALNERPVMVIDERGIITLWEGLENQLEHPRKWSDDGSIESIRQPIRGSSDVLVGIHFRHVSIARTPFHISRAANII